MSMQCLGSRFEFFSSRDSLLCSAISLGVAITTEPSDGALLLFLSIGFPIRMPTCVLTEGVGVTAATSRLEWLDAAELGALETKFSDFGDVGVDIAASCLIVILMVWSF